MSRHLLSDPQQTNKQSDISARCTADVQKHLNWNLVAARCISPPLKPPLGRAPLIERREIFLEKKKSLSRPSDDRTKATTPPGCLLITTPWASRHPRDVGEKGCATAHVSGQSNWRLDEEDLSLWPDLYKTPQSEFACIGRKENALRLGTLNCAIQRHQMQFAGFYGVRKIVPFQLILGMC
ncbi:hypothetical protein CEXT_696251 [Caerostris extrusa]|uniref:Uncharacterized protein n=1 Tax=Caerostris extrusa TaxID=172846 RepID=A0AAV4XIS7_CAEEX|nr:hypothetical protein CEXT_696251 [Caerostris extrusa]